MCGIGAPSEGVFFGTVDSGPCPDSIFLHPHSFCSISRRVLWPISIASHILRVVPVALRNSRPAGHRDRLDDQTEAQVFAGAGDDHLDREDVADVMVLMDGDLHMGSILVKDGRVTGIVDWGEAGYCIKEKEYVEAKMRAPEAPLEKAIDDFVPAFLERFSLWKHVINEMRIYSGL